VYIKKHDDLTVLFYVYRKIIKPSVCIGSVSYAQLLQRGYIISINIYIIMYGGVLLE